MAVIDRQLVPLAVVDRCSRAAATLQHLDSDLAQPLTTKHVVDLADRHLRSEAEYLVDLSEQSHRRGKILFGGIGDCTEASGLNAKTFDTLERDYALSLRRCTKLGREERGFLAQGQPTAGTGQSGGSREDFNSCRATVGPEAATNRPGSRAASYQPGYLCRRAAPLRDCIR